MKILLEDFKLNNFKLKCNILIEVQRKGKIYE